MHLMYVATWDNAVEARILHAENFPGRKLRDRRAFRAVHMHLKEREIHLKPVERRLPSEPNV